jgi:hypothetical protein
MNSRGKQRVGNEGEVRKLLFTNQGKLEVTDIEDKTHTATPLVNAVALLLLFSVCSAL